MSTYEILVLVILWCVAVFFFFSARRRRRSIAAINSYIKDFEALCEDETVNLELLESMQKVFNISCHWCGAVHILRALILNEISPEHRKKVEVSHLVSTKNLRAETARRIVRAYEAVFLYASYSLPLIGWVVRLLIRRVGRRAYQTKRPAIFLHTGRRLLAA